MIWKAVLETDVFPLEFPIIFGGLELDVASGRLEVEPFKIKQFSI